MTEDEWRQQRAERVAAARALPLKKPERLDPALEALFRLLDERERSIISARLGGATLTELAPYFDRETERIRQIQNRALALMRYVAWRDCQGYIAPALEMQLVRIFGAKAWDGALDPRPRPQEMGYKRKQVRDR